MILKQWGVFTAIFISSLLQGFAQTGSIRGTVSDNKLNEALVGVNVYVQGTTIGAATDLNGQFTISNLKPGEYNLVASYISYKTKIVEKVKVSAGTQTTVSISLEDDAIVLKGVVIEGKRLTQSEVNLINVMKTSDQVISGVSGQAITKTMDRDASEVIKRVPGVTIIGGRFVMIRGLSERYNSVWLNGASTPSSESDVKAFSFDVIPSSYIDNLLIYKTASADLPSDYAGGSIQIFTKSVPENNGFSFSISESYRQGTTFNKLMKAQGGKLDWLGFDDGTRALPKDFPAADEFVRLLNSTDPADRQRIVKFGREMNKNWTYSPGTALPDQRISFGFNRRFNVKKITLGTISSINYTNTNTFYKIYRADYQNYDTILDKSVLYYYNNDEQYTNQVKLGAMHNWSLAVGKGLKIDFRNLFNQISYSRTVIRNGYENYGGNTILANEFRFLSRTTYSGQLGGEYKFNKDRAELTWTLAYAYSNRNEPDIRRLSFNKVEEDPSDPHYGKYAMQFFFAASPEKVGRLYINMNENVKVASANYKQKITFSEKFIPELRGGFFFEFKDREFSARNIGYKMSNLFRFNHELPFLPVNKIFSNVNINDTTGIGLDEKTNASDSYKASTSLFANYLSLKIPVAKKINITLGARLEQGKQTLSSFQTDNPTIPVNISTDTFNIYPSINLNYDINKKQLIRLAYGITLNRPEFREIAPYLFYDFEAKAGIRGNPDIKNAYIKNFDLRYECYPSTKEIIAFGGFLKKFNNPIETYVVPAGSGLEYTFRNAEIATSYGLELDIRRSFEKYHDHPGALRYLKDFSFVFNGAVIHSLVQFGNNTLEKDRPMQGQSPYIVNTGIYYQNDSIKTSISLLYNIIGKRVVYVGDPYSNTPDVYEMPRHNLDLIISKSFGENWQFKIGWQDILNQEIIYKQTISYHKDTDSDGKGDGKVSRDELRLSYFPGSYFSIGISFSK